MKTKPPWMPQRWNKLGQLPDDPQPEAAAETRLSLLGSLGLGVGTCSCLAPQGPEHAVQHEAGSRSLKGMGPSSPLNDGQIDWISIPDFWEPLGQFKIPCIWKGKGNQTNQMWGKKCNIIFSLFLV